MAEGDDDTSSQAIEDLLEQADGMAHGAAQVGVAEDAVRRADLRNDPALGFRARKKLIESTIFSGFPEKTLVAFAWCLGLCEREPQRFHEKEWLGFGADLLWSYKWITENAPCFPQISREQLEATFLDMEARYRKHGLSLRPVHLQRTRLALGVDDDLDAAVRSFEAFTRSPRDEYADCEACELNFEVEYWLRAGDPERAVRWAEPLLSGALGCGEVPHVTLALLVRPLLELGRAEQARQARRTGYRMCAGQQNFLREVALHMDYESAVHGRQALAMLERHLPIALDTLDGARRFWFYWAARNLVRRLQARGREALTLRLPARLGVVCDEDGRPRTSSLLAWFEQETRALARAFDARNQNDGFSRLADDPGLSVPDAP